MSRTFVIGLGAIAWTGVAVVAIGHLVMGDLLVPAAMFLVFLGGLVLSLARHTASRPAVSAQR